MIRRSSGVALAALVVVCTVWFLREPVAPNGERPAGKQAFQDGVIRHNQITGHKAKNPGSPSNSVQAPMALESISERIEFVKTLIQMDGGSLFEQWRDLIAAGQDPIRASFVGGALSRALQTETNSDTTYQKISAFLSDQTNSQTSKKQLIEILGQTATPSALELLLSFAGTASDSILIQAAMHQIEYMGDVRWDARFHEELSPMLERAWEQSSSTTNFASAFAFALAKVGAPRGVDLLIDSVTNAASTVSGFEKQNNENAWAAMEALKHVQNPNSIPVLKARLADQPPDSVELLASGTALAAMGLRDATQVLLNWTRTTTEDVSPLAKLWFAGLHDTESLQLVEKELAEKLPFNNEKNQIAVQSALDEWHSSRINN